MRSAISEERLTDLTGAPLLIRCRPARWPLALPEALVNIGCCCSSTALPPKGTSAAPIDAVLHILRPRKLSSSPQPYSSRLLVKRLELPSNHALLKGGSSREPLDSFDFCVPSPHLSFPLLTLPSAGSAVVVLVDHGSRIPLLQQ
jgi:hypothetical protein